MVPQIPIPTSIIDKALQVHGISHISNSTIREIASIANDIEQAVGVKFLRMEIGVPSLAPSLIGIQAEIESLRNGAAEKYPPLEGISELKHEASRFFKAFANIDIERTCCIPTVGSMQGSFASFLLTCQLHQQKKTILFLDPGFQVHKQQAIVMGFKIESFDIYSHRGFDFEQKLDSLRSSGKIASLIYSNPNNPTWICSTDQELEIIGRLADKHNTIVIEDLAYFGMDFRHDISKPFQPPYQPTVAKFCNNYIILLSSSKIFSYAGQRIALMAISNHLYHKNFNSLLEKYGIGEFGNVMIQRVLYTLSAGASNSAQYALAALLKEACNGSYNFVESVKEYGLRAHTMKALFIKNHFSITYPNDLDNEIADGFYFTVNYNGLTASETQYKLLQLGISTISLKSGGCEKEGLRICVSQIKRDQMAELESRLSMFSQFHAN